MTYEEYKKRINDNSNASIFKRDSYSKSLISNEKLMDIGDWKPYQSAYGFNPDLDTSEGLYNLAIQSGLKNQADNAVTKAGGESTKYLSGGFIMDAADILNTLDYGVVGLLKGKTFAEGVKERQSFSDEDALGKYGWTGKLAGLVLDIAVDPLTYFAPWKTLGKIPAFAKAAEAAKAKAFGELHTIKIAGQEMQWRTGGWSPLNFLADNLVYGHAVDKNFRRMFEEANANKQNALSSADELIGMFSKIDPKVAKETLTFADDGSMITRDIEELRRTGSFGDRMPIAEEMYAMRDRLMKELVDEGVISETAAKTHWNTYLKQAYDEYLIQKNKGFKGRSKGIGLDNTTRTATKETRGRLTHAEDAAAVWAGTYKKQIETLYNARINRMVANNFSFDDVQRQKFIDDGIDEADRANRAAQLVQVPKSTIYEIKGAQVDYKVALKETKKAIKILRKQRGVALKDEAGILAEIGRIEKEFGALKEGGEKNLGEAITGLKRMLQKEGITLGPAKKVPTTQGQIALAEAISKWLKRGTKSDRLLRETFSTQEIYDEMFEVSKGITYAKTKEGIALQKAFDDPQMMYQWRSSLEFLDAIRYPDKAIIQSEARESVVELTKKQSDTAIARAEKSARRMGSLMMTKESDEVALKLVQKQIDRLEIEYSDLLFKRKNILDSLNENARGQLAGKWMHKDTWAMLRESTDPTRQIGEPIIQHFKRAKVIWNLSSYPRNAMSAMVQNWWRLGMGPWKLGTYMDAVKELRSNGPILKEMKENGFSLRSGALGEVLTNYVNDLTLGKSIGGNFVNVKDKLKHVDRLFANTYGHIDNVAKIAAYKYGREVRGWSPEKAMKAAYEATYNYSQVTPFVHQMRRAIWGVPFITFNLKSVELVASTLKHAPHRISVFGKARNALLEAAGVEGEQEAEVMPEWMKESFMLRLPWKDGEGRSMYFDMSYILPIGAIMNGEYLRNPVGQNPVLQTVKELSQNKTFGGQRIFNEFDDMDQVLSDVFIHVAKLGLPPIFAEQAAKGYDSNGNRVFGNISMFRDRDTQDMGAGERNYYQEAFRLAGVNVTPFDLESKERSFDWNRKRNLQQMLSEEGILKEFVRPYIPEDGVYETENLYDSRNSPGGARTAY